MPRGPNTCLFTDQRSGAMRRPQNAPRSSPSVARATDNQHTKLSLLSHLLPIKSDIKRADCLSGAMWRPQHTPHGSLSNAHAAKTSAILMELWSTAGPASSLPLPTSTEGRGAGDSTGKTSHEAQTSPSGSGQQAFSTTPRQEGFVLQFQAQFEDQVCSIHRPTSGFLQLTNLIVGGL